MAVRFLIIWPQNGKIILDYSGETDVITKVLTSERRKESWCQTDTALERRDWSLLGWTMECSHKSRNPSGF